MEKNFISDNGTVDEELLCRFFADSRRMCISDNGFSRRVMHGLQEEVPERQRVVYYVWTVAWALVSIVAFFVSGGVGIIRDAFHGLADSAAGIWTTLRTSVDWSSLLPSADLHASTPVMAVLTVVVLGSIALWDIAQR